MIDEYLNIAMEEEASAGSLAEAVAVEKSLAELDLASAGVNPGGGQIGQQLGQQLGPTQPGLKMAPRPGGPMVGGMGEVRW